MSFTYNVFKIVKTIPKGKVMSYKEVAKKAGNELAYRAVGNIIHKNPDLKNIPCHRIVKSNYSLSSNYAFGGVNAQKKKLEEEGIQFEKYKIINYTDKDN